MYYAVFEISLFHPQYNTVISLIFTQINNSKDSLESMFQNECYQEKDLKSDKIPHILVYLQIFSEHTIFTSYITFLKYFFQGTCPSMAVFSFK